MLMKLTACSYVENNWSSFGRVYKESKIRPFHTIKYLHTQAFLGPLYVICFFGELLTMGGEGGEFLSRQPSCF
jgi:hypothetical protein